MGSLLGTQTAEVSGILQVNKDGIGKTEFAVDQTLETVGAFACGQQLTLSERLDVRMVISIVLQLMSTMSLIPGTTEDGIFGNQKLVCNESVLDKVMEDMSMLLLHSKFFLNYRYHFQCAKKIY